MSGSKFAQVLGGFLIAAALAVPAAVQAQFNTPNVNAAITAGEYGTHANGFNQYTATFANQIYYCTWDATNFYIAVDNAAVGEGISLYFDFNALAPVDGGTNAEGTNVGTGYDNHNHARLPFRADTVIYIGGTGYNDVNYANGANGWTNGGSAVSTVANNGGGLREVSVPWNVITNGAGRPSQFNWLGYCTNQGSGYIYGSTPNNNPNSDVLGAGPTNVRWEYYWTVSNTGDGTATKPFAQLSYVFNRTADFTGVGALNLWDFTMSTPGFQIVRGSGSSGDWLINNRMLITAGTVDFGATNDGCRVQGNCDIQGGTLDLSTGFGGDLSLDRQLTVLSGATLTTNNRYVEFVGSNNSTIELQAPIDRLRMAKDNNIPTLTLISDVTMTTQLEMLAGNIVVNGQDFLLQFSGPDSGTNGVTHDGIATSGIVLGKLIRNIAASSAGARFFPVGTVVNEFSWARATFQTGSSTAGSLAVEPFDAEHPNEGTNFLVSRYWQLDDVNLANYDVDLQFAYITEDLNVLPNGPADEPFIRPARYQGFVSPLEIWDDGSPNNISDPFTLDTVNNTATQTNVTTMSPWSLILNNGLAVDLTSFTATTSGPGAPVTLAWETAAELDSAGFRIHVGSADGPTVGGLVPAEGSASSGASYSLVDSNGLAAGETRDYYLVEVELDGSTNTYGPASVSAGNGPASSVSDWTMY